MTLENESEPCGVGRGPARGVPFLGSEPFNGSLRSGAEFGISPREAALICWAAAICIGASVGLGIKLPWL